MRRLFDIALVRPLDTLEPDEQALCRLVDELANDRDVAPLLARITAAFSGLQAPSQSVLVRLANALTTAPDDARLAFWRKARIRHPAREFVFACQAAAIIDCYRSNASRAAGTTEMVGILVDGLSRFPQLVPGFEEIADMARRAGDPYWLRYRLAKLRSMLAIAAARTSESRSPAVSSHDDDDDDSHDEGINGIDVREYYSELLEQYHDDDAAMDDIRSIGKEIEALEEQGVLPRVLIRRGGWRA